MLSLPNKRGFFKIYFIEVTLIYKIICIIVFYQQDSSRFDDPSTSWKILRVTLYLPAASFDNGDSANGHWKLMSSHGGVRQFTQSTYNYFP